MRVSILKRVPQDLELAAAWNYLAEQMERPEVFYTYQWSAAVDRAFNATLRPLLCLIYDGDRLCGVAALATARNSRKSAFFLSADTADYCDIISEPNLRRAVMEVLLAEIRKLGITDLVLANLPAESRTLRELPETAVSHKFHLNQRSAYECGLVVLGSETERRTLLESVRSRDREKRGLRKMSAMGPVHLVHHEGTPPDSELETISSAQISRFLASSRISPLVQADRRRFLAELGRLLAEAGWLRISSLQVGEQSIAWNYGFRYAGSWFWYLPTFQVQHEDNSPGSCLLRLMLEEACLDSSVKRLDLGLGDESYKQRFANAVCPTRYVQLSTSIWQQYMITTRQVLTNLVSRSKPVEHWLRKSREKVRNLRRRVHVDGLMASAAYGLTRAKRSLTSTDAVLFFEAQPSVVRTSAGAILVPLDWQELSTAAVESSGDPETLQYLMRCAARLRSRASSGYVLRLGGTETAHFLWIGDYDGFHSLEIDYQLEGSRSQAMIFDCWTPVAHRGHGYYADAIRRVANQIQAEGKRAWIFSAATNRSSIRGISKAEFEYRFSLVRKTTFGVSTVVKQDASDARHVD